MNLPLFVARKYFWSARKKTFINVISTICVVAIAFGTMAMIIVMSLFNGLEGLIRSLFESFDAPLKITTTIGKTFTADDVFLDELESIEGVKFISKVAEDHAYIRYRENEAIVIIKGIETKRMSTGRLKSHLVSGTDELYRDSIPYSIIGQGVQYALNIPAGNEFYALQAYYPNEINLGSIGMGSRVFNQEIILPGGVFAIEKQFDEEYIFVPIEWAMRLFGWDQRFSSLEVEIRQGFKKHQVKERIRNHLGDNFEVLDSDEQHASLYKVVKIEKLFSFLGLSVILLIASINIFFALTMLVIDKKKDISILGAMGINQLTVRKIFIYEGAIMSIGGGLIGVFLGLTFCLLQINYGILTMGTPSAVMNAYPIDIQWLDIVLIFVAVIIITFLVTLQPAKKAAQMSTRFNN